MLDRVVLKGGGKAWWGTLLARARAEQMWRTHRGGKKAVSRPLPPPEIARSINQTPPPLPSY